MTTQFAVGDRVALNAKFGYWQGTTGTITSRVDGFWTVGVDPGGPCDFRDILVTTAEIDLLRPTAATSRSTWTSR